MNPVSTDEITLGYYASREVGGFTVDGVRNDWLIEAAQLQLMITLMGKKSTKMMTMPKRQSLSISTRKNPLPVMGQISRAFQRAVHINAERF